MPVQKEVAEEAPLEAGTYEILRSRLQKSANELQDSLNKLNDKRKEVFGSIETVLIANERINTDNNCVPKDMVPIGSKFIFGYNVHLGLKTTTQLSDVFSIYNYEGHTFNKADLELISDQRFLEDFEKLYKYYKDTQFIKFAVLGLNLFMVFRIGKSVTDIKTFKWAINHESLTYLDNRSDHEFVFPEQHEFKFKKTARDYHREGKHPHISIEDKVFVETLGGDLTIKVEDNTDSGLGIYSEPVDNKDQTLDDAEIHYAILGNIILLKIRPYLENKYRYIAYNIKLQEARRVEGIEDSCVLLPEEQGILYANGYYLQTGESKQFENGLTKMFFEKRIFSPNGEDVLFVFYNKDSGIYLLLPYNIIKQKVENPIVCHGYSLFENGELSYFTGDDEPKKHHAVRIWQTPFTGPNFQIQTGVESYLSKVGNKDVVRAMSESHEIITLLFKQDSYNNLYNDILKLSSDILDAYPWLEKEEAMKVASPLKSIKETASAAIDEYEKVRQIKKNTNSEVEKVKEKAEELLKKIKRVVPETIYEFVDFLSQLRIIRGENVSLKNLRYVDIKVVESYEKQLEENNKKISEDTVKFLLKEGSLAPYEAKVAGFGQSIIEVKKVIEIKQLQEEVVKLSSELQMLIEIISNLQIEDTTQTTRIIDHISAIYSSLNKINADLKRRHKELISVEGKSEFNAQINLVNQGLINYLDVSDSPQKCEEYQTKLMVQIEELEGKFAEFDEFMEKIADVRNEIYNAFESKKVSLIEARQRRANALMQSADRIIKAIQNRITRFQSVAEINGYFASDIMMEKAREIVAELIEAGDTVKADDIQSKLKTVREESIRQLKDKNDLFVEGKDIIKFGTHQFLVNTQNLDLSIVPKDNALFYHLTGTNFYEKVNDQILLENSKLWDQVLVSEDQQIYRAEYLAYNILKDALTGRESQELAEEASANADELYKMTEAELVQYVQKYMSLRYHEGYVKGVHDHDAAVILKTLLKFNKTSGLLRYSSQSRACAALFWTIYLAEEKRKSLNSELKGIGIIVRIFQNKNEFQSIISNLQKQLLDFISVEGLFEEDIHEDGGAYLFHEVSSSDDFIIAPEAAELHDKVWAFLEKGKIKKEFEDSLKLLEDNKIQQYKLVKSWMKAYIDQELKTSSSYLDEASFLLLSKTYSSKKVLNVILKEELAGLVGSHPVIQAQKYFLDFNSFLNRLRKFERTSVPRFEAFTSTKKKLMESFHEELRLNEFKPRVLSSFVRNQLIDTVYLPLIGANLAKQIGAAGEGKRTDLMGMLLLISPPGYGKTTLMEYIASRLGVIFMKINGPAIGNAVTSIDPAQASNSAAREELEKLNLAFEMGDNVMIYLDDIQHCNPEFLQKFISLCDAQRKIEGIYKGKSKTYDFRGKKVCVVMAGNPYTESGDKFSIPDMLANRADIYNLGDIIGDSADAFKLSYIENCLTSNVTLNKISSKSQKDVLTLAKMAETGKKEGFNFENNHSVQEVSEAIAVLKKLLVVRDIILKVNQEYIRSAAQAEEFRTEPPFKLQGSYRNMNKIAEKIAPIMNDQELETLILSHYENEAQTLTTGAEANLLKFKELIEKLTPQQATRWDEIKQIYQKNQRMRGFGNNQMGQVIAQIETLSEGLIGIKEALTSGKKK